MKGSFTCRFVRHNDATTAPGRFAMEDLVHRPQNHHAKFRRHFCTERHALLLGGPYMHSKRICERPEAPAWEVIELRGVRDVCVLLSLCLCPLVACRLLVSYLVWMRLPLVL